MALLGGQEARYVALHSDAENRDTHAGRAAQRLSWSLQLASGDLGADDKSPTSEEAAADPVRVTKTTGLYGRPRRSLRSASWPRPVSSDESAS